MRYDRVAGTGKSDDQEMKGNYVPSHKFFHFIQADLQVFTFHEVGDSDHLAHIIVDGVELYDSVIRIRKNINKRVRTN